MRLSISIRLTAPLSLLLLLLIPLLSLLSVPPVTAGQETSCGHPVLRVVDGDTLVVRINGKTEKIRLLNVDTPESVHPDPGRNTAMGKAASDYTRKRLQGQRICLEFEESTRGKYGRLLAYVIRDGQNFNLELVREGWSPYYTKYGPSLRYHQAFQTAEDQAREAGRKIWNDKNHVPESVAAKDVIPKTDLPPHMVAGPDQAQSPGPFRGNIKSRIFHRPGCRWYACKNCTKIFPTRDDATAAGFRACRLCRP